MTPSAAIVIPSYGRPDLLRRTLQSLVDAQWPPSFTGVWVVENGPQTGLQALCQEFAARLPLHYLHEPQLGLSAARNAGARACQGEVILFLDNDVRVAPDALTAYAQAFADYPDAGAFGGPIVPDYDAVPADWLRPYLPWSAAGVNLGPDNKYIDEPRFVGLNHAVTRAALTDAGFFDAIGATGKRGGVGEETRLQERIMAGGRRLVYVAGAAVWHYVPAGNCSPQWVLGRVFRHGLTRGLLDPPRGRHRLAGAPLWAWLRWLRLTLRVYACRLCGESLEKRFALEYERAKWAGVIAGCRGRKQ
ncbi:MAG: glycosyltransferase family 2 protein [Immundisolibacter sp.]|uniref:glycosyltransferase family 2 protein n=1 Tax=Immundisolibacter sp. TaxID=1934948 RepID=UPI003EE2CB6E